MAEAPTEQHAPWLLLMFSLSAKQASQRVGVWRKLKKYGSVSLRTSGYLLPNRPENQERFEWLAAAIRKYKGKASVAQVHALDDLPSEKLQAIFIAERSKDYEVLIRDLKKIAGKGKREPGDLAKFRRRLQEIAAIDFFNSPLRSRAEALLQSADSIGESKAIPSSGRKTRKEYLDRVWLTRPRPGIDRVSSAWLIRRFIDPAARFVFATDPRQQPKAVPFDMFQAGGFGHRGDDCTFETLRKEFGIRDPKVEVIAEIIHDADLCDEKFGRSEGLGLDRVLIGWANQGISDDELLRRGMELIEGLYRSIS
ncbi:MAG TPA: chromate resistance protein ChrB domain-containing protein [Clostridia bacterium]|nr:chromate resistance protein ChrB domain-containing protein [Clostridia bacterium]